MLYADGIFAVERCTPHVRRAVAEMASPVIRRCRCDLERQMYLIVRRVLPLVLCLLAENACAVVYTGFETDNEGGRTSFIGFQTGKQIVYDLFLSDLDYRYIDNGATVDVNQKTVTPVLGIRRYGRWSKTFLIGPTFLLKDEDKGGTPLRTRQVGGTLKFSLYSTDPGVRKELLASYSTNDQFTWARARIKQAINNNVSIGGELLLMGNDDAQSAGAGVLLEWDGRSGGVAIKVGYKKSTNDENTPYGGAEAFIPF